MTHRRPRIGADGPLARGLCACLLVFALARCDAQEPPPRYEVLELSGTPYERGLQHGRKLSSKIKGFYTTMLTTSLLPFFNREQADIAAVLTAYQAPEYCCGQFSYRLLAESAVELAKSIPEDLREEMRGVADGAGMTFDQILLLNTFVDSVLATRSVVHFLRQASAPAVVQVLWLSPGLETDTVDNDGDGKTDEKNEGQVLEYAASATATMVEVPLDAKLRVVLTDLDTGVDPASVRLIVDGEVYGAGHPALVVSPRQEKKGPSATDVVADWTPPVPLAAGQVITLGIQAGDKSVITEPPPTKARTMRTEQVTFTTQGLGKLPHEVPNRGQGDPDSQPTSISWAVRGSATVDGKPLLAHHFTLLDAGTSHKHTVVQIHRPAVGPPFAFVGWAGIVWGFSGMNGHGLAFSANLSDTLNNPLTARFKEAVFAAKLVSSGVPIGIVGRQVLAQAKTAAEGAAIVQAQQHTFGWNVLLADAAGGLQAVEAHANILEDPAAEPATYTPDTTLPGHADPYGRPWASVGPDDLRMGVHFQRYSEDLEFSLGYDVRPQRFWSTYFFPSQRAFWALGDAIAGRYGQLDRAAAIDVLRLPALVDRNDSMHATVYEPALRRFSAAVGRVPATDAPFVTFTVPEAQ